MRTQGGQEFIVTTDPVSFLEVSAEKILVKFKPEVDARTITEIQKAMKLEMIQKFSSPNLFLMKITDGASVETIIKRLNTYDAVKYAEPNYGVKATQ